MIGRQLSHFYIVGPLGSGGMGDVYEAQDLRLPRSVALKVLKPSLLENRTAQRRFDREARLAASLNHPNICTILDIGEADGLSFMAMELLQGESLKQRLRNGPMPLGQLLDVAIDVAGALTVAHLADIIHRDITPGNIFVTTSGVTKLLDFGLAKALVVDDEEADGATTDGVTDFGVVPGTVHYLSPEQLLNQPVDRRSDLWALGAVLYQASTGARPFEARTKTEVIQQILSRSPLPPRRLVATLPEAFEQVVMRLLEADPERRYQRAADLLKDLKALKSDQQPPSARPTRRQANMSLAVLPFTAIGDNTELLASFRDGLASDTAWALQQVPGLRVASRTSIDSVRNLAIHEIGERIGVEHVLEGSIQQAAGRFRVVAGLVATQHEERLRMPLRIDLPAADVLSAQDEAVRQIVAAVRSTATRSTSAMTTSPEAYAEYQRGLHAQRDVFAGSWNTVIEHGTRATDLDPAFAPAHVMLADTYNSLGLLSLMKPRVAFQKARLAAERALDIDPDLASAHAALGLVRFGDDWDWSAAETHFRRALDIDPDLASARVHYSWLLMLLGREAAALAEANRAVSTWRTRFIITGAAVTYFLADRYDDAIALCDEALDGQPDYLFAVYQRGQCYHMKGMYPSAQAELERGAKIGGRAPFYIALLGKSFGEAGMRDNALGIVRELDEMQNRRYVAPHCYVYIYHGLGEREKALLHQEDAYRDGGQPLNYLSPFIRNLFSLDPTHRDRLRQMRLTV
ncbi:MAG: protein kinase [Vicinamibacterales bacterium]